MSALQRTLVTACILCLFTLLGMSSSAQVADANWLDPTLAGDRFSPLKEINRSNVAKLKAICTIRCQRCLRFRPVRLLLTARCTSRLKGSYAIDASTCAEKWKQHRHSDTPSMLLVNRGFAYANGRLFRGTSDSHVLAMDPADGHVLWDHVLDIQGPGVSVPMAPIAANGLVYIGNAGGDQVGVTGHVMRSMPRMVTRCGSLTSCGDWPGACDVDESKVSDLRRRVLDIVDPRRTQRCAVRARRGSGA